MIGKENRLPELIDEILKCNQSLFEEDDATYFDIIGRAYDEDLISRMLAYAILRDGGLVRKLIEFAGESSTDIIKKSVRCEMSVTGGRIDIFVEAEDSMGQKYTLTIENKVNSWEHNDQTNMYYRYIEKNYTKDKWKNLYFFLKPVYNTSLCSCKQFKQITYEDLYALIDDCKDDKIIDLKKHIKKYFCGEISMNDANIKILENYEELKKIISETDSIYAAEKQQLFSILKNKFDVEEKGWKTDVLSYGDSYRIYKENWYHKDKDEASSFYFYVELLYVDSAPNKILVQGTVKTYGNNAKNRAVVKFIQDEEIKCSNENRYYIFYQKTFDSKNRLYSEKWKKELEKFALEHMGEAIAEIDRIFELFQGYMKESKQS